MKNKIGHAAVTILFIIVLLLVAVPAVRAAQLDAVDEALGRLGTSKDGYYTWCIEIITQGFKSIDTELAGIGEDSNLAGLFQNTVDNVIGEFNGIDNEEGALNKFNEILEGIK